jgi:D-sedoheptulose 7-phosphate isomerase
MQVNMESIQNILTEVVTLAQRLKNSKEFNDVIEKITERMIECFRNGNKVMFCGNGGSAAEAQHLAAELSGKFYLDRQPLPAEALHVNSSYITAVANDYSFDKIYSRYISGIGKKGDILVGLSTSGNSENIIQAFISARENGITTVAFTGESGGKLKKLSDFIVPVPSKQIPRIQEIHLLIGHIICETVESKLFQKPESELKKS